MEQGLRATEGSGSSGAGGGGGNLTQVWGAGQALSPGERGPLGRLSRASQEVSWKLFPLEGKGRKQQRHVALTGCREDEQTVAAGCN